MMKAALLTTAVLFYLVLSACGGQGNMGGVWVSGKSDSVIVEVRDIVESQGFRVIVDSQNMDELSVEYDASLISPLISVLFIGVTIDLDKNGEVGCYLVTVSAQRKSDGKYCARSECSREIVEEARRLMEKVVLPRLRKRYSVGEWENVIGQM